MTRHHETEEERWQRQVVELLPARVASKVAVDPATGCWIWQASVKPNGYGQIGIGRTVMYAHRVVYELVRGAIPTGREVDHLCRNRACVNPDHLEPVTHAENVRRTRKTHCLNGHALNDDNVYVWNGLRYCRPCRIARANERKRRLRAST